MEKRVQTTMSKVSIHISTCLYRCQVFYAVVPGFEASHVVVSDVVACLVT